MFAPDDQNSTQSCNKINQNCHSFLQSEYPSLSPNQRQSIDETTLTLTTTTRVLMDRCWRLDSPPESWWTGVDHWIHHHQSLDGRVLMPEPQITMWLWQWRQRGGEGLDTGSGSGRRRRSDDDDSVDVGWVESSADGPSTNDHLERAQAGRGMHVRPELEQDACVEEETHRWGGGCWSSWQRRTVWWCCEWYCSAV